MATDFDPYDKDSWYFGKISRDEATNLLNKETESGVFVVRDSSTLRDGLVLCVKEGSKVSHYIIEKVTQGNQIRFVIGDQVFPDVPSLLSFYKLHLLDESNLIRPVTKAAEKVRALFDFDGSGDSEDLPFKKHEILTIIAKDEDLWWTARNRFGQTGSIPVNYLQTIEKKIELEKKAPDCSSTSDEKKESAPSQPKTSRNPLQDAPYKTPSIHRQLPALARVKKARVPNAYDKSALKLEIGDLVTVIKTNLDGLWEGEVNGKKGLFPFNFVEFIDTGDEENSTNTTS